MQKRLSYLLLLSLLFSSFPMNSNFVQEAHATACADPSWTTSEIETTIGSGFDVDVVDLDEDGDLDFITSDFYTDIKWFSNNGSGTFTATNIDGSVDGVKSVLPYDLDEDGDIDILAGDNTSGQIWFFENNGSESFTAAKIADFTDVRDIVVLDVNGAGGLDVAAVSYSTSTVKWWANDGSESFDSGTSIASLGGAIDLVTGDVNEDGNADIVASGATLTSGGTKIYFGDGAGSFTTQSLGTLNDGDPWIADVDGDGDEDVVKMRGGFYFYENDGSESFTSNYTNVGNLNGGNGITGVDLDDDGDLDFTLADYSNGWGWLENDGSETFSTNIILDDGSLHNDIAAGDFDGDGYMDLVGVKLSNNYPSLMMQTCDSTAPSVSSLSPVDDASAVAIDSNLVITFSENVDAETGNITIKKTLDDSTIESIDVTGGQVSGSGGTTITVDPASDLDGETEYYVLVDATAFDDAAGNSYAGIASSTAWSFTTADVTAPLLSSVEPLDDATEIAVGADLTLTFNETVVVGTGNVSILHAANDTAFEAIDVTSAAVTGSGTNTITVNPTSDLSNSTAYYVSIDATAFDDSSGNGYIGLSDSSAWNFTTLAAVLVESGGYGSAVLSQNYSWVRANTSVNDAFGDLDEESPNIEAIEYLYDLGIVDGYEDEEFKPEKEINRAEFLKILVELLELEDLEGSYCFYDVTDQWFAPYVCAAAELGWVQGYSDGNFRPAKTIELKEALKILVLAFEMQHDELEEGEEWYMPYWSVAGEKELLKEIIAVLSEELTRAEMAQLVYNALEL